MASIYCYIFSFLLQNFSLQLFCYFFPSLLLLPLLLQSDTSPLHFHFDWSILPLLLLSTRRLHPHPLPHTRRLHLQSHHLALSFPSIHALPFLEPILRSWLLSFSFCLLLFEVGFFPLRVHLFPSLPLLYFYVPFCFYF